VKLVVPADRAQFGLAREDVTEWRTFICEVETVGADAYDVRSPPIYLISTRSMSPKVIGLVYIVGASPSKGRRR
jgi:hypothetical protein